ncbi:MAG: hypothetical protein ACYTED_14935 [Planctomycetota bacterium]|jgi:hypothetical protein
MLIALFNNFPVILLIEGGIFVTLAIGVRLGRRVIRSDSRANPPGQARRTAGS